MTDDAPAIDPVDTIDAAEIKDKLDNLIGLVREMNGRFEALQATLETLK